MFLSLSEYARAYRVYCVFGTLKFLKFRGTFCFQTTLHSGEIPLVLSAKGRLLRMMRLNCFRYSFFAAILVVLAACECMLQSKLLFILLTPWIWVDTTSTAISAFFVECFDFSASISWQFFLCVHCGDSFFVLFSMVEKKGEKSTAYMRIGVCLHIIYVW